jgi:hypothetical protein
VCNFSGFVSMYYIYRVFHHSSSFCRRLHHVQGITPRALHPEVEDFLVRPIISGREGHVLPVEILVYHIILQYLSVLVSGCNP